MCECERERERVREEEEEDWGSSMNEWMNEWMIGVLGHDSALVRLYWAGQPGSGGYLGGKLHTIYKQRLESFKHKYS